MVAVLKQPKSVEELADLLGQAEVAGDAAATIDTVATLQDAKAGSLAFLANSKYRKYLATTKATAVVLTREAALEFAGVAIIVDDPYVAYAALTRALFPAAKQAPGIHPRAIVDPQALVDDSAYIGPNVVVEANARIGARAQLSAGVFVGVDTIIGEDTFVHPNVSLLHGIQIGARCIIHSGAVIGSDGFGFANNRGEWEKVHQLGSVIIGDDVEIGANTTIDRGALTDTIIERGSKLDNLIQIAHNVKIGESTAIAACAGLAGSTVIGKHCTVGGGTGFSGHMELTDNVHITGFTMVTKSIDKPGVYSSGLSAVEAKKWRKSHARLHQLDEMAKKIKVLEKALEQNQNITKE